MKPLLLVFVIACASQDRLAPEDKTAIGEIDQIAILARGHAIDADAGLVEVDVHAIHCAAAGIERRRKLPQPDAGGIGCLAPK